MDIVHGWYEVPQHVKDGALVIGTFDGTPRGHRAVLDAAKAKASNGGLPVWATIFEPPRKEQKPFFRLTQLMRDLAEQVIKQAHAAYEQLAAFVTKAMDAWVGTMPSPMATGFKDVRERAMDFAKENAELSVHVRRQDQQCTDPPRDFDASDAVRSRPDADLRYANAGTIQLDRRNSPEVRRRLIFE